MFTTWDGNLTTWDNQTTLWDYVANGFSRVILVCPSSRKYDVPAVNRFLGVEATDRTYTIAPAVFKVSC